MKKSCRIISFTYDFLFSRPPFNKKKIHFYLNMFLLLSDSTCQKKSRELHIKNESIETLTASCLNPYDKTGSFLAWLFIFIHSLSLSLSLSLFENIFVTNHFRLKLNRKQNNNNNNMMSLLYF